MTKSTINCRFCGNVLAKPTGGKAKVFGGLHGIEEELPDTAISTVQKGQKNQDARLLLDSMIIHQILNGHPVRAFTRAMSNPNKTLLILDRILIETIHMEKYEYGVSLTREQIIDKLKVIAPVEILQVDHASTEMINSRNIYDSAKYVNSKGTALSETDCILLQMHLNNSADLVTHDKTLIMAAGQEGRSLLSD